MRSILTIIIILCSVYSQAQFLRADHKKASELKHRPLVVALFDPETDAQNVCDSSFMVWYNAHIEEAFRTNWTLGDSIVFLSGRRVASLIASKSHEHIIFSAGLSREGQQSSGDVFWYPSFTFMLFLSEDGAKLDEKAVDRGMYSETLVPDIEMTGQLHRGKYIFKLSFARMALSENDLAFAISQFDKNIREALSAKKSKGSIYASRIPKEVTARLKNMTLLIPENFNADSINKEEIANHYSHSFRIVTEEEINRAIASGEKQTAFIHYLWSDHERMFTGFVVNAGSFEVMASFKPGQLRLDKEECIPAGTSYRTMIRGKAKQLKGLR